MNKNEQIDYLVELLERNKPQEVFDEISKNEHGIFGALNYLHDKQGAVISKDICGALKISSARMAILLKKMIAKGLVEKRNSKEDARAVLISLTEKGEMVCANIKENLRLKAERLLDELGLERMERHFEDMNKIKVIMQDNSIFDEEGIDD